METKKLFYGGKWVEGASTRAIINPATGEVISTVAEADASDAEKVIRAARDAFDSHIWSDMSVYERAALLVRTAELIEQNADRINKLEADNSGKLYAHATTEAAGAAALFRYYAGIASIPSGKTFNNRSDLFVMTVRQPIGVCAAIIPWNYPLFTTALSIVPPLVAGNTVVLKPASITPCTAIVLVELMERAGFPAGVINLLTGSGSVIGDLIAESSLVDQIMFTGGTDTGRRVMSRASINIKRLELELGGKSPVILFDDCDKDVAVDNVLMGIYSGQGQLCTAGSRLIVQDGIYDEIVARIAKASDKIKLGYGDDSEAGMCSLISREHMEQVLGYIEKGKKEGARLVSGGYRDTVGDLARGFFVRPTVFADVTNDMTVAQEEIFGPVLVIERFRTLDEAVAIANGTKYGLAGAVYTNDLSKAEQVIRRVRCGVMWVNTYLDAIFDAPMSGLGQSGLGTIGGVVGIESFTEQKQINIKLHPCKVGMFES